ncbi:MAG: TRAP transporter permease [Dehalobacterium sp.]
MSNNDVAKTTDASTGGWSFRKHIVLICKAIAVVFAVFQIYTALTVPLAALLQRSIHLGFAAALVFMMPLADEKRSLVGKISDVIFSIMGIGSMVYMMVNYHNLTWKIGSLAPIDVAMGWVAIIMILEGTRRTMGIAMPLVALVTLLYTMFGYLLPGAFGHIGYNHNRIANSLYLSTDGIFGTPLGVCATVVAVFIIFGVMLEKSRAGDFIIQLATAVLGTVRGGPAKIAIVASGCFGTISGSVVANVVGTGSFTIPMMKRTGFHPNFAGAVEACASTGGMIMPPIMGTVAFLMADILAVPYWDVVKVAFIPAVLYYTALFFAVDFKAGSIGMKGLPKSELPKLGEVMKKGWLFLLPIVLLLYFMGGLAFSAQKSGIWACVCILAVVIIRREFTLERFIHMLEAAGKGIVGVAMAMACSGIIIGCFTLTGLGLKMSSLLIFASGGELVFLLLLTVLACIILGMGVSCTAAYIILAVLVAPALTKMGVVPMAAHMFVFYYGAMANITPPVALGSYAAAAISGGSPMRTGFIGLRLAVPAMIVPFLFVYNPALIMETGFANAIVPAITGTIGTVLLAAALQGYFLRKMNWLMRIISIIAGILMIIPENYTDIIGILVAALLIGFEILHNKHEKSRPKGEATSESEAIAE